MADLVTRLMLDSSEHNQAMNEATQTVKNYSKQASDANASIKNMQQATSRSTQEILGQMKGMENLGRSMSNYKRQMMQLSREIADLTINYRSMSQAQQESAFGQEVASKIQELTQKASEYKDAIGDVQAQITALASDTADWDSLKSGIDVVSSSMQAFVSMGVLGEKQTEDLVAVLAKLKAMEVATNAVIKVGNALQKQSALMLGVTKVQALAAAAATKAQATATTGATVAQKIFNAVAKANPYVLLASAIIAVGTALVAFATKSKEAEKASEERQKKLEEAQQAEQDFRSAISSNCASIIASYEKLRLEWKALSSDQEKAKWIKENQTEFTNLGISVENVSDAENVFVRNTGAIVTAFKLRAEAAAYGGKATEAYGKMIERQEELQSRLVGANDKNIYSTSHNATTGDEYIGNDGSWHFTQQGANKHNAQVMNDPLLNQLKAEADRYVQAQVDLERQVQELLNTTNIKTSSTTSGTDDNKSNDKPKEVFKEGSLKKAQQELNEIQEQLNRAVVGTEDFNNLVVKFDAAKKKVDDIQKAMKVAETDSRSEVEKKVALYDDIKKKIDAITNQYKIGAIDKASAMAAIKDLNEQLASNGLNKIDVELDPKMDEGAIERIQTTMSDVVSGVRGANNAFIGLGNSIKNVFENAADMDAWDWFTTIASIIWQIVDAFEAVNTVVELFKTVQLAAGAAATTAAAQEVGASTAVTAAKTTEMTAEAGEAVAGATSSGAKLPFPANLIAIAAGVAAVIGAIALIGSITGSFATGGIVGGGSYTGDSTLIRANAGEAVLNQRQQSHLFNILNGKESGNTETNGQVEFKIRGNELVGVLNNYSKKRNKV